MGFPNARNGSCLGLVLLANNRSKRRQTLLKHMRLYEVLSLHNQITENVLTALSRAYCWLGRMSLDFLAGGIFKISQQIGREIRHWLRLLEHRNRWQIGSKSVDWGTNLPAVDSGTTPRMAHNFKNDMRFDPSACSTSQGQQ